MKAARTTLRDYLAANLGANVGANVAANVGANVGAKWVRMLDIGALTGSRIIRILVYVTVNA